ncbi:MFS transporter [Plantactinospora sp. KLBMP9567]|uniref:CynX/NimT family MFS transporter n=1 Tax=Plantactinospora sp. KLBMP9567 TaxID=3085900 RepID=UPI002981A8FF|nr:MFS transporter [Plantactinospora sp. KLBMP9567]MDW5330274.1 MFS transporter [Plantactinospora sp. KLBMP9567]
MTSPHRPGPSPLPRWHRPLLVAGIVLAALNLRPALAGVSPLLDQIMAEFRLSPAAGGLVTTVMVVCLGVAAPFTAPVAHRLGHERTLLACLALLAAGTLLRSVGGQVTLYLGAAVAGSAIGVLNVLMPALVRRHFPSRVGLLTGAYVSALVLGAALAAGLTIPLQHAIGAGWRPVAAAGALLVVPALLVWLPWAHGQVSEPSIRRPFRTLLRTPITWYVTGFMGLQSLTFYTALAWLPTIYTDAGLAPTEAGFLLGLANLTQIATTLTVPVFAARARTQRGYVTAAAVLTIAGYLGTLLAPGSASWLWAILLGLGQGASIALALLLIALRAPDAGTVTALSSIAQSMGYVLAATGPVLVGALHQASGEWAVPLGSVLVLLVAQLAVGLKAGRPGTGSTG